MPKMLLLVFVSAFTLLTCYAAALRHSKHSEVNADGYNFLSMTNQVQMRLAQAWMPSDSLGDHDRELNLLKLDNTTEFFHDLGSFKHRDQDTGQQHQMMRRRMVKDLLVQKVPAAEFLSLVSAYGQVYRDEFASKRAVFLSHISKSAGTELCMCSWDSGCRAWGSANKDDNCHARGRSSPMDTPAWGGVVHRTKLFSTCNQLYEYNSANRFTVEGNENHLIQEGLCSDFWNVIIMREPIERLMAHLSYLYDLDEVADRQWAQVKVGLYWDPSHITTETAFNALPIVTNNFYIRNLLGHKGYKLGFGEVTEAHLEEAKRILEQFDLVMLKNDALSYNIQHLMGWRCSTPSTRSGHTEEYAKLLKSHWGPEQWERLERANRLDIELYKYAIKLYAMDKLIFESPSFSSSTKSECPATSVNGTCGYLCK